MHKFILVFAAALLPVLAKAQMGYWQQRADYVIRAALDPQVHQYHGEEIITYTNNSPDTLAQLFFHLFPNAFRPGSMMDIRSRTIADPDRRVGDRISKLSEAEAGYLHITSLTVDGALLTVDEQETVAQIALTKPIYPGDTVTLSLSFEGQVPIQIRRSGRDNAEGVDYSMPQWYPKLAEYDADGWHPNPYVGREFFGVWGDFDVTIGLPAVYVFIGTGYEADAKTPGNDVFFGKSGKRKSSASLQLHRRLAPEVHDFTWAAERDFVLRSLQRADGIRLEAAYIPGESTTANWELLLPIMDEAMTYANRHFGQYPYKKYAFVQGGDGGMEYAMLTLITGQRSLNSLVGVSVHEMMHSWYQFVLATNESLYPWMDEGFTSYASAEIMNHLVAQGLLPGGEIEVNPHVGTVTGYARFANTGRAEALSTHADHYTTNAAYGVGSYSKGELFLYQLKTIIGEDAFDRGMLRYFNTWKMRHPTGHDFLRIMERESGQVLDWYYEYMINTTHQVDYAVIGSDSLDRGKSTIRLDRIGVMPFPVTVTITDLSGEKHSVLIPVDLQRGHAPLHEGQLLSAPWPWTHPTYSFEVNIPNDQIASIEINAGFDHSESDASNDRFPRVEPE